VSGDYISYIFVLTTFLAAAAAALLLLHLNKIFVYHISKVLAQQASKESVDCSRIISDE